MENDIQYKAQHFDPALIHKVKAELNELDRELVTIEGNQLKPSQCYHFDVSPLHILFNTNCPDSLKEKVKAILSKYISSHEDGAQQQSFASR